MISTRKGRGVHRYKLRHQTRNQMKDLTTTGFKNNRHPSVGGGLLTRIEDKNTQRGGKKMTINDDPGSQEEKLRRTEKNN